MECSIDAGINIALLPVTLKKKKKKRKEKNKRAKLPNKLREQQQQQQQNPQAVLEQKVIKKYFISPSGPEIFIPVHEAQ